MERNLSGNGMVSLLKAAANTLSNTSLAIDYNWPDKTNKRKKGRKEREGGRERKEEKCCAVYSDSRASTAASLGGLARLSPIDAPKIPTTTNRLWRGFRISMSNVSAASLTAITPSTRPTAWGCMYGVRYYNARKIKTPYIGRNMYN